MGATQSSRSTRDAVIRATNKAALNKTPPHLVRPTTINPREHEQLPANEGVLAQNLKLMGQVKVDSAMTVNRSLQMTHIVRTRAQSETDNVAQNGTSIDALALSQLLDARKDAQTRATALQLAQRYKLDAALVERLATRYNTPSIGRETTLGLPDGDRRTYREATWVDPPFHSS